MEEIVEQVYLSLYVRLLMWRMERNRAEMGALIRAGAAYSSPKLCKLDIKNQRLGMRLHTRLLRLLVLRAIAHQKQGCRRLGLYGGGSARWIGEPDVAYERFRLKNIERPSRMMRL